MLSSEGFHTSAQYRELGSILSVLLYLLLHVCMLSSEGFHTSAQFRELGCILYVSIVFISHFRYQVVDLSLLAFLMLGSN